LTDIYRDLQRRREKKNGCCQRDHKAKRLVGPFNNLIAFIHLYRVKKRKKRKKENDRNKEKARGAGKFKERENIKIK
jgi:hypothetical protein